MHFNAKDIVGQRFGKLVAIEPTLKRSSGGIIWKCKCDCGKIAYVQGGNLKRNKSCGCLTSDLISQKLIKDIVGQRFGRLLVLNLPPQERSKCLKWKCLCDCGKITYAIGMNLRNGNTKSCGCLAREIASKSKRIDITGQRFGRIVAIESTTKRSGGNIVWKFRCDCGEIAYVPTSNLGMVKSCGCLQDATRWSRNTNINPMNVPFEITNLIKAKRELEKAIKQAS